MAGCSGHRTYVGGCPRCQLGSTSYTRTRRQALAQGRWHAAVPVGRVRAHVTALRAAGMTVVAIAEEAGIGQATIVDLNRPGRVFVQAATAHALATVRLTTTFRRGLVPVIGSARRVQALCAVGWSVSEQARRLHCKRTTIRRIAAMDLPAVTEATARRITDLHDELFTVDGPSTKARTMARRHGWDRQFWPDETIDDPHAPPSGPAGALDDVAVARVLAGDTMAGLGRAETDEMVRCGTLSGLSQRELAAALGTTTRRIGRSRRRLRCGGSLSHAA